MLRLLGVVAVVGVVVVAEGYQCTSRAECNYNGECANGKCSCYAGWQGEACDMLRLVRSPKNIGYQGNEAGEAVTSWGGSVVRGDDGVYHMYAAEIADNCGMNVWLANSRVIHASSPDPLTVPFTKQGVVQGVFSHEPVAARAPTGEYVVYYTAVFPINHPPVKGGQRCTGCKDGISPASCGTDGSERNRSVNLPTYMVYSKSPNGPWSTPAMVPGTDQFADSNFAPLILPNGSLVALTRNTVYQGKDWKDVSSYKAVGNWPEEGEDPSLWIDGNGVLHAIIHMGPRSDTYGMHYFSTDGVTWTPSPNKGHAYPAFLNFTDGSDLHLGCRERPHIVVNGTTPIALTNGAAPVTCHDAGANDHAYTSLQIISH